MMTLIELAKRQLTREGLMIIRQIRYLLNSSLFFLMVLVFFPLTMPSDIHLLQTIAPGLVWIAMLLSFLMSQERIFQQDYEDGVLEQWLVSGQPLSMLIFCKLTVHWFFSILPIILLCPLVVLMFSLGSYPMFILMGSLILGSPTLLFLCALSSVFSGGLKQKGVFMSLILLPLTLPVMIFGSGVVNLAVQELPVVGYLALLLAISIVAIGLLPFAIAALMRISLID